MEISPERLKEILPRLRRGKLKSGERMTLEEARYILRLDNLYTCTEIAALVTGKMSSIIGMQLVTAAENRLGRNLKKELAVLHKSNGNGKHVE